MFVTCSFFLAAASSALVAPDLKLPFEDLLWMELVLALCRRLPCVDFD